METTEKGNQQNEEKQNKGFKISGKIIFLIVFCVLTIIPLSFFVLICLSPFLTIYFIFDLYFSYKAAKLHPVKQTKKPILNAELLNLLTKK